MCVKGDSRTVKTCDTTMVFQRRGQEVMHVLVQLLQGEAVRNDRTVTGSCFYKDIGNGSGFKFSHFYAII